MRTVDSLLESEEARVLQILYDDWMDLLRCTTIDQAMERVRVPFSHKRRLRIADLLRQDKRAAALMRWDLSAYVLTNDEKLFARLILRAAPSLALIPDPESLGTAAMDWSRGGIPQALEALEWVGFLEHDTDGYKLAPGQARVVNGIGLNFHEVVLTDRGERFNTNCATDFFIMTHPPTRQRVLEHLSCKHLPEITDGISKKMTAAIRAASARGRSLAQASDYTRERAILNDACAWTHEPIGIALDSGELTEVTPETTWYLRGGG
ncbi:MAG TPA: hypothetical protein VKV28_15045 [Candidatus Binataceae bacterium]|nr:hypothetical protein [Candidatus Binataceae bacterium]